MKPLLIFYFTLLNLIVLSYFSSLAQEQSVQKTEPEKKEQVTYRISEIPVKLEETSAFLSVLYDQLLKPEEIEDLENKFDEVLKKYSLLKAVTDSVKMEEQSTTTLKEYKKRWIFQKKQIADWSDEVTSVTEKLEEQKKTLLEYKYIWLRTHTLAREEKADKIIINKIGNILTEINNAESLIVDEINSSLNFQAKLYRQSVDVDVTIRKINDLLLAKKREIFVRNSPPLWESISARADTNGLSYQVKSIWDSYTRTTEEFYTEKRDRFITSIIYFLLLLIVIFALKYYSRNLKSDDPKVIRALKILKTPVSITILISLFTLAIFYGDFSEILISLLRILVVFPLIIVLNGLIKPAFRLPLYLFAMLLVLQQIQLITANDTEIERVLLILINVIALSGLFWMLSSKRFDKAFTKESHENKAKALSIFLMTIFIISLIANILGYVMLSITLITGVINSTFGIILLLTAAVAIEGILIIFLRTKLANILNVVKHHPEIIEHKLEKIMKLAISLLAIVIILNNFGVREIVFNWLVKILGQKWIIGNISISLGNIIFFIISIWLSVAVARFVKFILEGDVLPKFNLPRGVPGTISILSSYLIIGFGIIIAVVGAGIDLNSFALLAGALGIGIGFGLQDIVMNFISGLILIFERPIQIGDAVQVEELSGRVQHIGIRSSTIKTWEGAEVIVPNGNLISNKLINWTLSDHRRRIDIKIGVAYGTDVNLVMETLLEVAKINDKILTSPAPYVLFNDFGESSLDFELRCWTADFALWIEIRSDLRIAVEKAFREKKIEIPFPQRDLHLRSGLNLVEDSPDKESDVKV